jgi:hypothetical protein
VEIQNNEVVKNAYFGSSENTQGGAS